MTVRFACEKDIPANEQPALSGRESSSAGQT